jgi:hypothetical protein
MDAILIHGSKDKLQLLLKLAKELGLEQQTLSEDEALLLLAKQSKTGKFVSEDEVRKALKEV